MSQGPGHVQRTILAMIEAEPHGAWTVEEICRRIYPTEAVEKKHRVAVLRALTRVLLPGTWWAKYISVPGGGRTCCVYDLCDDEGEMRAAYAESWQRRHYADFDAWVKDERSNCDRALEAVAKRRKYRDASAVEKLDLQIADQRTMIGLLSSGGTAAQLEKRSPSAQSMSPT